MRTCCEWLLCAVALATGEVVRADISNPGYEYGPFGVGAPFAGGTSRKLTEAVPNGWALAALGSGNEDRWVESAAAHSGSRYVSLSSALPWPSDDCLQGKSFDAWEKGLTFRYSAWVASADAGEGSNRFNFEFREYLQGGGFVDSVYSFDLAPNPGWSDNDLTVLPWQQVSQSHTFRSDALRVDFWIASQEDAAGGTSSVAIDDVGFQLVPAPSTVIVFVLAGLTRRRRR